MKAKLNKAKEEGNTALVAKLQALVGFGGTYNIDNNVHMNVMLLDGSLGELKIRYKHFMALKSEIDKLRSQGVDPLSLTDGRFFVFHKDGKGNETNFKVDVYKEKVEAIVNGKTKMVDEDLVSCISQEVLSRVDSELHHLEDLFEQPTAAEVAEIVAESDLMTGKSPACDRIFDAKWKAKRESSKITPNTSTNIATEIEEVDDMVTKHEAAMLPTGEVVGLIANGTLYTTLTPEAVKVTQSKSVSEMSDEEFFKAIG